MAEFIAHGLIIRYPHLVEPWSSGPQYKADFNAQLIVPENWPQWQAFIDVCQQALRDKHGNTPPTNMKMPWLNEFLQPNLQKDGPYVGFYCFNAYGKQTKPGVCGPGGPEDDTFDDLKTKTLIFSGCRVNVLLGVYGYPKGVGVALNGIQLIDNQNVERIPDAGRNLGNSFQAIPGAPPAIMPAFSGPTAPDNSGNPFG